MSSTTQVVTPNSFSGTGEMSNLAIERSVPVVPAGMLPPGLEGDYAVVRQLPIFHGVPDQELALAIGKRGISVRRFERDMFVPGQPPPPPAGAPLGPQAAPVCLVATGQVAAAVFVEAELAARRAAQWQHERASTQERAEESLLKPPPLARIALKNVALFADGELFNAGAIAAAPGQPVAFYTAAPTTLVAIEPAWIAQLASRHPPLEERLRRALSLSRERMAWLFGVKQELLDFFIRQGISVAGQMVRVRQLGLCIDCKQCEEACEERYGARRLTLGGYQLGMLDFVYTCRTCTDQRCVDPCAYDSIKFDPVKREVVINEATCTGCTACAQSCPYGAIDMVDVEDARSPTYKEAFKLRLDQRGALTFGAGTPRIARARRIANKCDHCAAYGDQACISACPTGSLIELDAADLFRERSPGMAEVARGGYDRDLGKQERREVLPVLPFTEGVDVHTGGLARVKRGRYAPLLCWVVGVVAFLVALGEGLLRLYQPAMSYRFGQLRAMKDFADLPAQAILEKVTFRGGDQLSTWCGVIGVALMAIAAIYPVFRRIRVFRWLASNTMWFDFHLMAGTIGPMFIGLHSVLRLDTWVSSAFWSMVIVVLSGFLGRYLYTQVPELSAGIDLEELDHQRAFGQARATHPVAMAEIDREITDHAARADAIARSPSVLGALIWLFAEDLRRVPRRFARRGRLARLGVERRARNDLARRGGRMLVVARGKVVAPKAQLLLHAWKKVHVPFTVLLTVFSAAHMWLSWSHANW